MANWKIWIRGVFEADLDFEIQNEVALTALPTALQTVDNTEWVGVQVLGIDESEEPVADALEGFGSSLINVPGMLMAYSFRSEPYSFDTDRAEYKRLLQQFTRNYVLVCLDGLYQPDETKYPERFHSVGNCLITAYSDKPTLVHNYDEGTKEVEVQLRAVIPTYE